MLPVHVPSTRQWDVKQAAIEEGNNNASKVKDVQERKDQVSKVPSV